MANRSRSQWGDDERAGVGARHRTPARGVPVEVDEETSANYSGQELHAFRARRPTPERVSRLEDFKDEVGQRLTKVETNLDTLIDWHREDREERRIEKAGQVGIEKVRINNRAKIIIALIGVVTASISVLGTLAATGKL